MELILNYGILGNTIIQYVEGHITYIWQYMAIFVMFCNILQIYGLIYSTIHWSYAFCQCMK